MHKILYNFTGIIEQKGERETPTNIRLESIYQSKKNNNNNKDTKRTEING